MTSDFSTKITYYERFYNKIDPELKEAVNNGFKKAETKLDPSLFKNIEVHFASDFDYLTCDTYSRQVLTTYPECRGLYGFFNTVEDKSIYLQERMFVIFPRALGTLVNNAKKLMENASIHELGHLFDTYYVNADPELEKKHKDLCYKMDIEQKNLTEEEIKTLIEYYNSDSYSDSDEFKKALLKDFQSFKTPRQMLNYPYLLQDFFGELDLNHRPKNIPDEKRIEEAFTGRSEVFAQLFSYAIGTDDGEKERFTSRFKNTYKVVQEYIKKHSK